MVALERRQGLGGVGPGLRCCPDRRPSLGQSQHVASTFSRGCRAAAVAAEQWLQNCVLWPGVGLWVPTDASNAGPTR